MDDAGQHSTTAAEALAEERVQRHRDPAVTGRPFAELSAGRLALDQVLVETFSSSRRVWPDDLVERLAHRAGRRERARARGRQQPPAQGRRARR
jgi:hypothetical protein